MKKVKGHNERLILYIVYFVQPGKMSIPTDCDKLHIYNVTPRTTIKKIMQRDAFKTKKLHQFQNNPKQAGKVKQK